MSFYTKLQNFSQLFILIEIRHS